MDTNKEEEKKIDNKEEKKDVGEEVKLHEDSKNEDNVEE